MIFNFGAQEKKAVKQEGRKAGRQEEVMLSWYEASSYLF